MFHPNEINEILKRMTIIRTAIHGIEYGHWSAENVTELLDDIQGILTQGRLFEKVIKEAKAQYYRPSDSDKLKRVQLAESIIGPYVAKHRRLEGAAKIEHLMNALVSNNPGTLDDLFDQLSEKNELDEHLLRTLDELIESANNTVYALEVLNILRDRIVAEIQTAGRQTNKFVKTLAFCLRLKSKEKRLTFIKQSIRSIEGLEEFAEFLSEGISASKSMKPQAGIPVLPPKTVSVMEEIYREMSTLNPLSKTGKEHIQGEDDISVPDMNMDDLIRVKYQEYLNPKV